MKIEKGKIYINSDGEFFTPAMSGDFIIVDMWQCDKTGLVPDIIENPSPKPVNTNDLKVIGFSSYAYNYPDFDIKF